MFWTISGIFCRKLVQSLSKIVKFWIKFVDVLFPKPKITTLKTQAGEGQDVVVSLNIHFVMFVAKTYLQVFLQSKLCHSNNMGPKNTSWQFLLSSMSDRSLKYSKSIPYYICCQNIHPSCFWQFIPSLAKRIMWFSTTLSDDWLKAWLMRPKR